MKILGKIGLLMHDRKIAFLGKKCYRNTDTKIEYSSICMRVKNVKLKI